ncbi:MAG: cobalt transporter CbiM [Parvibaculaceae bacterium]
MAHIPDGVLSVPVIVGGGVVTVSALGWSLKKIDDNDLPKAAVVAALFFVASLVNIAVGPTTVHLLLSGLMGLVIGWATVPAVFIALVLQAVFFGFGGISTLGVNTMNIALPGVFWAMVFAPLVRRSAESPGRVAVLGAVVAALAVLTTALLVAAVLALSDLAYVASAKVVLVTYIPLIAGEALIVGFASGFLARVKPDLFWFRRAKDTYV